MTNALKIVAATDDQLVVQNHIILFGGRDLDQEYFDPEVDLESDYTKSLGRLPVDFEHGFSPDDNYEEGLVGPGRDDVLGFVDWSTAVKTDLGWLVDRVLDRRNKYVQAFEPLIREGLMGTSSEAVEPGVEKREDGGIVRWPLRRDTMTVTPAEPKMLGDNALQAIKRLSQLSPEFAKAVSPILEAAKDTATDPEPGPAPGADLTGQPLVITEELLMPDQDTTVQDEAPGVEDQIKSLGTDLEALSGQVNKILNYLEDNPAARKAGVVAPGGEDLAPNVKSFADFLIAVRYGDMKRLRQVYKTGIDSKAFKDVSGTVGSAAGVLVPEQFTQELLKIDAMLSPAMSMVRPIPVGSDHGRYPALDNYVTPTAGSGQTAAAAGISVGNVAAGEALPESTPGFKQLQWLISKVGGTVDVENEVMDDSPLAIDALLRDLFRIAINAQNERNIFRGSGAGEPLGLLNAPAAIPITPATNDVFAYADALAMRARFKGFSRPAWFIHPGIWPDIGIFESSSGGGVWQANYQGAMGQALLGWPIYESEHLPQDDNSGCVVLVDLSVYLFFMRSSLAIAFSEHAKFVNDVGVWRFVQRNDGKPWLLNAITLADPQGSYTVSPIVYFND